MEHRSGGSLADWEGLGPSSEGAIPYNSNIPLETQWFLVGAFASNPYPSPNDFHVYASQTSLDVGIVRNWFSSQHLANAGGLSDNSDPSNATFPSGPVSAQSDLLAGNSSWIENKAESVADSGFHSQGSTGFSQGSLQQIDSSNYSASQFPLHIATDPSSNVYSQAAEPEGVPDVAWDLRSIATDLLHPGFYPTTASQPSYTEYNNQESYDISDRSTTVSLIERLQPCAVSPKAIGPSRSRSKRTTTSVKSHDGENATCEHCGAKFTGRYARGNCSRHIRQLHSEKPPHPNSDLVCRACAKHFKRQDARRKHEWRKHGLPDAEPHPRGSVAHSSYEPSHADTQETGNEQDAMSRTTALPEDTMADPQYCLPAETHWAYNHFTKARSQLVGKAYNDHCHDVLLYCGRIVDELRLQHSDLQHIFAQQLRDLYTQLRPGQHNPWGLESFGKDYMVDAQNANQDHEENTSGRQYKGKAPAGRRASKESSRHHPYAGRYPRKAGADPLVLALGNFGPLSETGLDCPMHKWHQMHGHESPCHGCGKPSMNAVRQHLHPEYSTQHRSKVTFIQRCENCKEDFIDELLWTQGRHGASACHARSQPRGHSVIVWARLFLKLYPEEVEVPSPYQNDLRCLPANFVSLLRDDLFGAQQPMSSSSQPQALAVLPAVHDAEYEHQDDPESRGLLTRFRQMEVEIARDATAGTLLARASELLTQLLSSDFRNTNQEQIDTDFIESFYRNQLTELRNARTQLIQAHRASLQSSVEQAPHSPSMQAQAQVPAFGGAADFPAQLYQPDEYMDMVQIPDSELNTQPSSRDYYAGDTSLGFTSFDGSSRTSQDYVNPANMGQSQQSSMQYQNLEDLVDCSPSCHNHGMYLSPWDAFSLDQPGPSRQAQQRVSAQFMSEVDSTMTSSFESTYALSHAPTEIADEDDTLFFDIS